MTDFRAFIHDVPDFPSPGVLFRDVTPLLASPDAPVASRAGIAMASSTRAGCGVKCSTTFWNAATVAVDGVRGWIQGNPRRSADEPVRLAAMVSTPLLQPGHSHEASLEGLLPNCFRRRLGGGRPSSQSTIRYACGRRVAADHCGRSLSQDHGPKAAIRPTSDMDGRNSRSHLDEPTE